MPTRRPKNADTGKNTKRTPRKPPAPRRLKASRTVALVPGPAEVTVDNLNVRGQAGLKGEVMAHLKKGDTVTVLSQINLDKHKANEPSQWAKIALPASTKVWVQSIVH